ncbi:MULTISPECIES: Uma2 family endonuclease [unclassified Microcoleus]|uniref:Uma2 family endonuclease n=1 Tax=unclassified Microcoleus TaxID=2642155 RepID=UPI002FD5B218
MLYLNFEKENSALKFEGNTKGVLIIRLLVAGDGVNPEADLMIDLGLWNRQTRLGSTFSASTVFKLPKGVDRSFDAAWIQRQRWEALLKLSYLRCGEHTQPDRCSARALTTNSPYPIPYTPE